MFGAESRSRKKLMAAQAERMRAQIDAAQIAPQTEESPEKSKRKPQWHWGALIIAAAITGAAWLLLKPAAFTGQDMDQVKASIKAEFEKRPGVQVLDVQLIRENGRKLTGFVRVAVGGLELTKGCSAIFGDDGRYLWQCR